MIRAIAPVTALLLSVALMQAGNGLQGTLLPVRAALEGFSTFSVGLLGSTYYVGFIAGCLLGAIMIRSVGHIRVFTAMAAVASATPLIHGLVATPVPWWILRVITGFCFAVLYIVIESWLNERATRETRGSIFAVYLVINLTLMTAGQMLLTVFDPGSLAVFAIWSILISIAAVPVALSPTQAPAPINRVRLNLRKIFRISPVGFIGCVAIGAANGAFWVLAPAFAAAGGLDVAGIAVFMSITVIGGAIGQWPLGKLSDHFDRRKVMLGACGAGMLAGAGLWLLGGEAGILLYALAGLWGVFSFPLYGLAVAHANDYANADEFVEVSGVLLLVYAGGAIVGPMIASLMIEALNAAYLFAYTASIHLLLAGFVIWRSRRRGVVAEEERVPYIKSLEAAQSVSSELDQTLQEELAESVEVEPHIAPAPDGEEPAEGRGGPVGNPVPAGVDSKNPGS